MIALMTCSWQYALKWSGCVIVRPYVIHLAAFMELTDTEMHSHMYDADTDTGVNSEMSSSMY